MSASETSQEKFGLRRQWSLCALMLLFALLICAATRTSFSGLFASRLSPAQQAIVAFGLSAGACINAWVGYKLASKRPVAQHTIESYSRLDLRGWNPALLAPAAGIGEEILFRGALQTLLGVWVSSALFVLAHTKAYRFNGLSPRVLMQAVGLFAVSLVLGAIAHFAGLVTAIVLHTVIDITGLYTVRHVAAQSLMPNNSSNRRRFAARLNSGVRRPTAMGTLKNIRLWINRDDGRYFQVGNRPLTALETTGLFFYICALILWLLHSKTGLSGLWALATGVIGLALYGAGSLRRRDDA